MSRFSERRAARRAAPPPPSSAPAHQEPDGDESSVLDHLRSLLVRGGKEVYDTGVNDVRDAGFRQNDFDEEETTGEQYDQNPEWYDRHWHDQEVSHDKFLDAQDAVHEKELAARDEFVGANWDRLAADTEVDSPDYIYDKANAGQTQEESRILDKLAGYNHDRTMKVYADKYGRTQAALDAVARDNEINLDTMRSAEDYLDNHLNQVRGVDNLDERFFEGNPLGGLDIYSWRRMQRRNKDRRSR